MSKSEIWLSSVYTLGSLEVIWRSFGDSKLKSHTYRPKKPIKKIKIYNMTQSEIWLKTAAHYSHFSSC